MAWLYGIQSGLFIKVGCANSIPARLKLMNLYNPHPCKVVMRRNLYGDAYWVERRMHEALKPYAIGREWFTADVALVKAVLTVVLRNRAREQADYQIWLAQAQQRAAERDAKRAARVLMVDSGAAKLRRMRKENKIKMMERLNGQ